MYDTVKIGEKEVPMLCMASCNVYYKQVFGEDPLKIINETERGNAEAVDLFSKMGFIMAKHAELKSRKLMRELTEDDYVDFLDQFKNADYLEALDKIADVYNGHKAETSEPKK